jgi:tetratricopeptide (TPR) repeat protein
MFSKIKKILNKIDDFFKKIVDSVKYFIKNTKYKLNNLYETNYNNGIKYLENGHIWDATFRFKMIKKFWPNKFEAQCKYAICLLILNMPKDAENLLNDILKIDNENYEAKELLEKIKDGKIKEITDEYVSKKQTNNN